MDDVVGCGPDGGVALHSPEQRVRFRPKVKGCHHGVKHWLHVHWRLDGQPMCRIECRCGKVIARDGRVGHSYDEVASWGWRVGTFA